MDNDWNKNIYLVGGDWNHGLEYDFPIINWEWNVIPTDRADLEKTEKTVAAARPCPIY